MISRFLFLPPCWPLAFMMDSNPSGIKSTNEPFLLCYQDQGVCHRHRDITNMVVFTLLLLSGKKNVEKFAIFIPAGFAFLFLSCNVLCEEGPYKESMEVDRLTRYPASFRYNPWLYHHMPKQLSRFATGIKRLSRFSGGALCHIASRRPVLAVVKGRDVIVEAWTEPRHGNITHSVELLTEIGGMIVCQGISGA